MSAKPFSCHGASVPVLVVTTALGLVLAVLAAAPALAQNDCSCFGRIPTFGCTVNGKVGPCVGTTGRDRIQGTNGDDVIISGDGRDKVRGGDGDDLICTGDDGDKVLGGMGDDRIDGGPGNDRLYGRRDDDLVFGGDGADKLRGGGQSDTLSGDAADDFLHGGAGTNTCVEGDRNRSCSELIAAVPESCGDGRLADGEECEATAHCDADA